MLEKIPGIDPIILNNVKDRTRKQIVHDARGLKITDKETKKKNKEWHQEGNSEELKKYLEEINAELEKQNVAIRLEMVEDQGKRFVEIIEIESGKVLQKISLKRVGMILGKTLNQTGFLIDDMV